MKHILYRLVLIVLIFSSCTTKRCENTCAEIKPAKFEPTDGKVLLFVGQDLSAIGGVEGYNNGYVDHFAMPAGVTMYTNFRVGDESYGHVYKGLDGLTTTDNWGSGDCNIQMLLNDSKFDSCALAIGLELVNHDSLTAVGAHDDLIINLGNWMKAQEHRAIFLRIGYEFDAPEWNHYNAKYYKSAFVRIKEKLDSMKVDNYATVWQSKGWGSDSTELMRYYPGDEYVDWCGYSHFGFGLEGSQDMLALARSLNKPVFIAESTPQFTPDSSLHLADSIAAKKAWNEYYIPLFKHIEENSDVIKALSYINIDWYTQDMWKSNPPFMYIDSRLQMNEDIKDKWSTAVVNNNMFIHKEDSFFSF